MYCSALTWNVVNCTINGIYNHEQWKKRNRTKFSLFLNFSLTETVEECASFCCWCRLSNLLCVINGMPRLIVGVWATNCFFPFFLLNLIQECYLENDQTSLYHTAKGLMTLQALYGTIPQIYGKGDCARVSSSYSLYVFYWYLCSFWDKVILNLPKRGILCWSAACCQHDAENEERVCRHSEPDPACVRHSSAPGPQRWPAHSFGHTAHLWGAHRWNLWNK